MSGEPYDWARDDGLDFPDNAQSEPTQEEVSERVYYYEQHPYPLDLLSGVRDAG